MPSLHLVAPLILHPVTPLSELLSIVRMVHAGVTGWGRVDAHGKLLVVNLFILPEKTATGYPDTILNMLRNKGGRARLEISSPEGNQLRVYFCHFRPENAGYTL